MARPKSSKTPPTFGTPQKPAHLSPEAARQWDKLIKEIDASGLQITPAHRGLITLAAGKRPHVSYSLEPCQKTWLTDQHRFLIVRQRASERD